MSKRDFIAGYVAGKKAMRKMASLPKEDIDFLTGQVCDVIESDYSHESGDDLISTIFAVIDEALDSWEFGPKPKDEDIHAVYDKVLVELDSRGIQIWPGEQNWYMAGKKATRKRAALSKKASHLIDGTIGDFHIWLYEGRGGDICVAWENLFEPWLGTPGYRAIDIANHFGELYVDYGADIKIDGDTMREIRRWVKDALHEIGAATYV